MTEPTTEELAALLEDVASACRCMSNAPFWSKRHDWSLQAADRLSECLKRVE